MTKKVKMYEAEDGTLFKTKEEAREYENRDQEGCEFCGTMDSFSEVHAEAERAASDFFKKLTGERPSSSSIVKSTILSWESFKVENNITTPDSFIESVSGIFEMQSKMPLRAPKKQRNQPY